MKKVLLSVFSILMFGYSANAVAAPMPNMPLAAPADGNVVVDYTIDYTKCESFPFFVMGYTPEFSAEDGLMSSNPNGWYQYFVADGIPTEVGMDYTVTAEIWCDKNGSFNANMGWGWGSGEQTSSTVKVVGGEWTTTTFKFYSVGGTSCNVVFQPGGFDGQIKMRNLQVSHVEKSGAVIKDYVNQISNSDMEGADASCFVQKSNTGDDAGKFVTVITEGVGVNGSNGVEVATQGGAAEAWDAQFWIALPEALPAGSKINLSFDYKSEAPAKVSTQVHGDPGSYKGGAFGDLNFTADWQKFEKKSWVIGQDDVRSIAFNLCENKEEANKFYFDNIVVELEVVTEDPNAPIVEPKTDAMDLTNAGDLEGNTWNFDAFDASAYDYLVITTTQNSSAKNGAVKITDANGNSISGEDYTAGPRGKMWLDRWNNQQALCVKIANLADANVDVTAISSISVPDAENISSIYLTSYKGQATKSGGSLIAGDIVREYTTDKVGSYGTIALPYAASVSGAQIYTVESFDAAEGITLSQHTGLLEAGVPYFFMACDEEGNNGDKAQSNVNFFRAAADQVEGEFTADNAGNGLIGCYNGFAYGTAPLRGCYVLTNNEIRLIGSTADDVTVGKNRCFFDPAKYVGTSSTSNVRIPVAADATAISKVNNALNADKIYDMNGREVKSMQKGGMYIMGGMKVIIK